VTTLCKKMLFVKCFQAAPPPIEVPILHNRVLVLGQENSGKTTVFRTVFSKVPEEDPLVVHERAKETLEDSWKALIQGGCNIDTNLIQTLIANGKQSELLEILRDPRFQSFAWENGLGTAFDSAEFWSNHAQVLTSSQGIQSNVAIRAKVKHDQCVCYSTQWKNHTMDLMDVPNSLHDVKFLRNQQDISSICYVVGLDTFDQVDPISGKNLLELEVERFSKLINAVFKNNSETSVILFLNKVDVFERKLENGVSFSTSTRFSDFQMPKEKNMQAVTKAAGRYVGHMFRKSLPARLSKTRFFRFNVSSMDVDQCKRISRSIKLTILEQRLVEAGFI